eukprot:gene5807-8013_t
MLRATSKLNINIFKIQSRSFISIGKLTIPTDKEQQWGRRKEEMDAEAAGTGFNRDPIIPPADAGTKENPILVPSYASSRAVGYEDPLTHQLAWFNLAKGPLHFVPSIGLYFKLTN